MSWSHRETEQFSVHSSSDLHSLSLTTESNRLSAAAPGELRGQQPASLPPPGRVRGDILLYQIFFMSAPHNVQTNRAGADKQSR